MTYFAASGALLLNWAETKYFTKKNLVKTLLDWKNNLKHSKESLGPSGLKVSNLGFSGPVILYQTNSQSKFEKRWQSIRKITLQDPKQISGPLS